jgi:hypothetical protein
MYLEANLGFKGRRSPALELPERPQLVTEERMRRPFTALGAPHMDGAALELDR